MATPHSATTPTHFINLPPELRNKIWNFALSDSGSPITIFMNCPAPGVSLPSLSPLHYIYASSGWRICSRPHRAVPSLLSVNRESRALALGYYAKGFEIRRYWRYVRNANPEITEPMRRAVDGTGLRGLARRCMRVLGGGNWGNVGITACDHEKLLEGACSSIYWAPQHDWVSISRQAEGEGCGIRAMCRSPIFIVHTTFDSRIGKITMSEYAHDTFEDQNHNEVLVSFARFDMGLRGMERLGDKTRLEWTIKRDSWIS